MAEEVNNTHSFIIVQQMVMFTSNDPSLSSMDTSTGGLLTLVVFTRAISNNGPQINKISKIKKPPPNNSLFTNPSG